MYKICNFSFFFGVILAISRRILYNINSYYSI